MSTPIIHHFFSRKNEWFILGGILAVTLFCAFWSPEGSFVATPKYWWDESFAVETARTILESGRIDITVAPSTPSDKAITLSSNGFPLTLPLAAVYKLFGIGIVQTRLFMTIWILASILLLYTFMKKLFGMRAAAAGTLLVATFASFYANGRTATGDIPGFFLLVTALWLIALRKSFFMGGVVMGLAAVAKTSVLHMTLPAIAGALLWHYRKAAWQPLWRTTAGALCVGIIWFLLLLPQPYQLSDIAPGIAFYRNPTTKATLWERMPESLGEVAFSSTLWYFAVLGLCVWYGLRKRTLSDSQRIVTSFVAFYALLQIIVFFRSPGWIRYLIVLELLILLLLFPALEEMFRGRKRALGFIGIAMLATFQITQYLFFSNIFSTPNPTRMAEAINKVLAENPGSTVGFINNPMTAAWIPGDRKYQLVHVGGDTYAGTNPLALPPEQLPTFMASRDSEYARVLDTLYEPVTIEYGFVIWRRTN